MKIDCPHCGVHGSVDNSLLNKKLRCPKCSKVFLATEDILPEFDDRGMLNQEILYDDEPHSPDLPEDDDDLFATMAEGGDASSEEDFLGLMEDESGDNDSEDEIEDGGLELDEDEVELEKCSGCSELLHPAFLEPVGSEHLCALCLPEGYLGTENEEDSLAITETEEDAENVEEIEEIKEIKEIEEIEEIEEIDIELGEDPAELESDSSIQTLMDGDITDEVDDTDEVDEAIDLDEEELEVTEEESEDLEEDYPKEPCSVCGEEFHRDFMQEIDSKLFCGVCQPEVVEEKSDDDELVLAGAGAAAVAGAVVVTDDEEAENDELDELDELDEEGETDEEIDTRDESADEIETEDSETGNDFTVGELIKEAWQKTKGVKASVWGAVIVMLVVISGVFFGGITAFQAYYKGLDPNMTLGANCAAQLIANWLSMLMTGGIMLIGVRHVLEQRVTWKMVFAGFSKAFSITMALILQTILISIGFLLLVIPGIYLSVGYSLALPLILDKGMGPWEALEASRKAIHKKWWTVFGLYLVMVLLYIVSMIPFGIGLIWTIPMFFVLTGVLYVRLFGSDASTEEVPEEEQEDDSEDELEEEVEEDDELEEDSDESEEVEEKLDEISEEVESKK